MCHSLQKEPKVKVYVNETGHNILILTISKALLSYFIPNLMHLTQSKNHGLQNVVLHKINAKAASWILKWICTGGQDSPPTPAVVTQGGFTEELFRRLEVILYLGIKGKLRTNLEHALRNHWEKHPTSFGECIHKAYTLPFSTTEIRSTLVKATIDSVFACDMTVMSWCSDKYGDAHDAFRLDLMAELATSHMTNRILRKLQKGPLSTNQIHFIYLFTVHKSYLRRSLAKCLHVHINKMKLKDELVYRRYGKSNSEFMTDMHIAFHQMKKPAESKVAPILQAPAQKFKVAQGLKAQEPRLTLTPKLAEPKVTTIPKAQESRITRVTQVPKAHELKSTPILKPAEPKLDPIPKAQKPAHTATTKAQTPLKFAPIPQIQVQVRQLQQQAKKALRPKATKELNAKATMPKPRADEFYLVPTKQLSQATRKMAYRNTAKETARNKTETL